MCVCVIQLFNTQKVNTIVPKEFNRIKILIASVGDLRRHEMEYFYAKVSSNLDVGELEQQIQRHCIVSKAKINITTF